MSSLVILFLVVTAAIVPNVAGSISLQDIDLNKLISLVQSQRQQQINGNSRYDYSDSSSSSSDDYSDSSDDLTRTARIGENNLKQLITQIVNKNNKISSNDRKSQLSSSYVQRTHKYGNNNYKDDRSRNNDGAAQILEQLLNRGFRGVEHKSRSNARVPKKHLTPNRLLGNSNVGGLEDYSKIYVLLNTEAVERSKHTKDAVNDLISRIFSLSSSPSNRDQSSQLHQNRYKGFSLKQHAIRRRGRESREMYVPANSGDDKPKRVRASAGHTAIPYIRHRGDNIYERDN